VNIDPQIIFASARLFEGAVSRKKRRAVRTVTVHSISKPSSSHPRPRLETSTLVDYNREPIDFGQTDPLNSILQPEEFMKIVLALFTATALLAMVSGVVNSEEKKGDKKVPAVLNFKMKRLDGKEADLSKYQGKVVLMVNVASQCGLTPQYKQLEELHEKFSDKGLAVLGFPANEFGAQEPGTDTEISTFCTSKYGVKFDMFSKVVVKKLDNGPEPCPLYQYLTSKETDPKFGGEINWNFEKFLVGRNGEIVKRFAPRVKPDSEEVLKAIEEELAKK
jgi:glutathione peroxidase